MRRYLPKMLRQLIETWEDYQFYGWDQFGGVRGFVVDIVWILRGWMPD